MRPISTATTMISNGPASTAGRQPKLRGAFINTAQASCSIFESGLMVYDCIRTSDAYDLDYYSLDTIDVAHFEATGVVRLLNDPAQRFDAYDFWVFNWHFVTMATLNPAKIARLPGRKFTIVLELKSDNPIGMVPANVFDGYLALDPSAHPTATIFPFPRPLPTAPSRPPATPRDIPMIGSFGFGTPGKGFELLVEAVNREFDRAIVRVNIPSGTHVVTGHIHQTDYPRYIAALCERIAKPGIEIRFSYDFMSADELVTWCADNDLNCFMYTRCQPGLAATTDQAVMSGRPLLTLSNDTFRHIHAFIPPYPVMSLREAIATTPAAIERMQHAWSRATFNATFHDMLAAFGLGTTSLSSATGARPKRLEPPTVLVASRSESDADDPIDYDTRLARALSRTGSHTIVHARCTDVAALRERIADVEPAAVVVVDFDLRTQSHELSAALGSVDGPTIALVDERDLAAVSSGTGGLEILTRRPIVPFMTVNVGLNPRPGIVLIGYGAANSNLEDVIGQIVRDVPTGDLLVEAPELDVRLVAERVGAALRLHHVQAGLRVSVGALVRKAENLIAVLGAQHLIVVWNDPSRARELEDVTSLAMITERAVVFTRRSPFACYGNTVTYLEDLPLRQLLTLGMAAQIRALRDCGEWDVVSRIGQRLPTQSPLDRRAPGAARGAPPSLATHADRPEESPINTFGDIPAADIAFVQRLYTELLGRPADPDGLRHHLNLLRQGISREALANGLRDSAESRAFVARAVPAAVHQDGVDRRDRRPIVHEQPVLPAFRRPVILIVSHEARRCGIHEYGMNIAAALRTSTAYAFAYAECAGPNALAEALAAHQPAAVIYNYYPATMPWLTPDITRRSAVPQLGIMHEVTQDEADNATREMFDYHICPDPTLVERNPFALKTPRLLPAYDNVFAPPAIPTIGSFGFGIPDKGFERLIATVQREFDRARINLRLPFNDIIDPDGTKFAIPTADRCRMAVTAPGIELAISHDYLSKSEILDFLASNTLNAFFYDTQKHRGISSVIDYAVAVRRPIAITKCGMFRHILGSSPSIAIEDTSLRDIIRAGIGPLERFFHEWSSASFVAAYESIVYRALSAARAPLPAVEPAAIEDAATLTYANVGVKARGFNRILDNEARSIYSPTIATLFELVPDVMSRKIPEANVQQAFVLDTVAKFALARKKPSILCVGAYEDSAAMALNAMGVDVEGIDPIIDMDLETFYHAALSRGTSYDIVFSTSVIEHVKDDETFVRQIAGLLKPGGIAVLTCDFDDRYKPGDNIPDVDYRMYTQVDLRGRLLSNMPGCELVDTPAWNCPEPDFWYCQDPATPHIRFNYTFATFVVQKRSHAPRISRLPLFGPPAEAMRRTAAVS